MTKVLITSHYQHINILIAIYDNPFLNNNNPANINKTKKKINKKIIVE